MNIEVQPYETTESTQIITIRGKKPANMWFCSQYGSEWSDVLIFAGKEVIFIIVAGMVVCFGFRMRKNDNTLKFSLFLSSAAQNQRHFIF